VGSPRIEPSVETARPGGSDAAVHEYGADPFVASKLKLF
jgi:hypothetical protein